MRFASDSRRERIGATALLVPMMAASALLIAPWWFAVPVVAAFAAVWLWVLWFFRDPRRVIPEGPGLFVSPADGVVTDVTPLGGDSELGCEGVRIGVFMSIFDVHVNLRPCDGVVARLAGNVGKYLDARRRDAWRLNESHLVLLDHTADGTAYPVGVRQVAGLVARRIVCRVNVGDAVARGERFGLIKFGSRLELLLPSALGAEPVVRVGQRVFAGSTVLRGAAGRKVEGRTTMRDHPGFLTEAPRPRPPRMVRRRILRTTSAWPSLVTLGNGMAGFAAIHFATKPLPPAQIAAGEAAAGVWVAGNLVIAAWMIFVGMLCDALDGSLARRTGYTSEFGAQLDSLCDAITFGVAPALLMLRAVQADLFGFVQEVDILPRATMAGRAVWFIAAVYASCALLRLARFNVENTPDLAGHMTFKGLPSPAAAMSVTSLVLLHEHLVAAADPLLAAPWLSELVIWLLPVVTLGSGLLMVSQIRFAHLANTYLRGRRPFSYIVWMAIIALAALTYFRIFLAVTSLAYVLSGPVRHAWGKYRNRRAANIEPAYRQAGTQQGMSNNEVNGNGG